jgi:hypothetical protein
MRVCERERERGEGGLRTCRRRPCRGGDSDPDPESDPSAACRFTASSSWPLPLPLPLLWARVRRARMSDGDAIGCPSPPPVPAARGTLLGLMYGRRTGTVASTSGLTFPDE